MLTYHFIGADFPGGAQPTVVERIFTFLTCETFFHFGTFSQTRPSRGGARRARLRPLTNCWDILVLWSSTIHLVGTERLAVRYIFVLKVTPTSCPSFPPCCASIHLTAHALTHSWPYQGRTFLSWITFHFYSQWNPSRVKSLVNTSNSCVNNLFIYLEGFRMVYHSNKCVAIGTRWSIDEVTTSEKTWE